MLLLGLTGSIATGKSTVSALLSSPPYSLPLIDADLLARQVVEPGTYGYRQIVAHFSSTTSDLLLPADDPNFPDTGKGRWLNRPALGRRVFGTSEERERDRKVLNRIVHPLVRFAMVRAVLWCYLRGERAVVLDVPLLFEGRLDLFCGSVLVVGVSDPKIQMQRLRARDPHLSAEDAENRVRSQGDVREKCRRAEERREGGGYVVWNDGNKEDLKREVGRVMTKVEERSPRWWGWFLLLCPPGMMGVGVWAFVRNMIDRRRWEEERGREKAKL